MGRRGNSNRRSGSGQNRGGSGRGRGRSSSNNSMPLVLGGLGLVAVIAVVFLMMGDDKKKDDKDTKKDTVTSANKKTGSNLTKTNTPAKTTKSTKKTVDMAEMRRLKAQIDMSQYKKIDQLIAEASKLKAKALETRKAGNEAEFKKLITQAVNTWRKSANLSDNFLYEIDGRHDDLRDTLFKKESKRIHNASKAFRAYLGYETDGN